MTRGWHIARITIETTSPVSCTSQLHGGIESILVRDANGLPMIPGSTIQGLLVDLCAPCDRFALFGGREEDGSARPARLIFSNALAHDSANGVVSFPEAPEALFKDPILGQLLSEAPLRRDHVRLDHRHAATEKFTRSAVPTGTRFSFEILFAGYEDEACLLDRVVALLRHPLFRVGGASRRGYGRVRVLEARRGFVTNPQVFRSIMESPLCDQTRLSEGIRAADFADVTSIRLRLRAVNPWRTGANGLAVRTDEPDHPQADLRSKPVDAAPTREARITWDDHDKGTWSTPGSDRTGYILPGSAIRGPLAHRTLYHWNRIQGMVIDADTAPDVTVGKIAEWSSRRGRLNILLGTLNSTGTTTRPGTLIAEDVEISPQEVVVVNHNGIDRFTGGVRAGVVFSEELIIAEEFTSEILIDEREDLDADTRAALCHAIRDLCEGRLALGAKSYGFCVGSVDWGSSPPAHWMSAWGPT